MDAVNRRVKLALLLNMIAPYRVQLYSLLADQFDLMVLHGGKEANRDSWSGLQGALPKAKVVRAWGWRIHYLKKATGEVFDEKFIHITPGILWHLVRFRPDAIITGFSLRDGINLRKQSSASPFGSRGEELCTASV